MRLVKNHFGTTRKTAARPKLRQVLSVVDVWWLWFGRRALWEDSSDSDVSDPELKSKPQIAANLNNTNKTFDVLSLPQEAFKKQDLLGATSSYSTHLSEHRL